MDGKKEDEQKEKKPPDPPPEPKIDLQVCDDCTTEKLQEWFSDT